MKRILINNYITEYTINKKGVVRNPNGKIMKLNINSNGYYTFAISSKKKKYRKYLHRALAECFIPNHENKKCVNHINGNKLDCRIENLEWVTEKENSKHAYDMGLSQPTSGSCEKNNRTKLTNNLVHEICSFIDMGESNIEISKKMNISYNIIKQIRNGYTWKDISKLYNFIKK